MIKPIKIIHIYNTEKIKPVKTIYNQSFIYIYIYRERERERETYECKGNKKSQAHKEKPRIKSLLHL